MTASKPPRFPRLGMLRIGHTIGLSAVALILAGCRLFATPQIGCRELDGPSAPHAPSAWTVLADESFDTPVPMSDDAPWVGEWRVAWNTEGYATSVPDSGAPRSPGHVLQFEYPMGFTGGKGVGTPYLALGGATGVYVALWWKVSEGWDGHLTGSNKLQYIRMPNNDLFTMVMYEYAPGQFDLRVYNGLASLGTLQWLEPNVVNVPVTHGEWHQVEWLVDYMPGEWGTVCWWLDGLLLGDYSAIQFPNELLSEYQLSSVWGGTGDTKNSTDYYWYDHIHIRKR